MRESLTTGSTPFRKAYLRSLIDVIEVDDAQVRIKGSKDVLKSGCGQPAGNCHVGLDMPHDAADFTDREALQLGSTTGRTHMMGGGQLLRPQWPAGTVPAHPCPRPNGWDRSPVG
jgi:hypothetical protein